MTPPADSPENATIGDVFRVVNDLRKEVTETRRVLSGESASLRGELREFRTSVEGQLEEIRHRMEGQTESALNVALHVLGEQRGKLRELVHWANSQGARIDPLP